MEEPGPFVFAPPPAPPSPHYSSLACPPAELTPFLWVAPQMPPGHPLTSIAGLGLLTGPEGTLLASQNPRPVPCFHLHRRLLRSGTPHLPCPGPSPGSRRGLGSWLQKQPALLLRIKSQLLLSLWPKPKIKSYSEKENLLTYFLRQIVPSPWLVYYILNFDLFWLDFLCKLGYVHLCFLRF